MSIWKPCVCAGTKAEKMNNWRVKTRKGNRTFNRSPRGSLHPSKFSEVICLVCGAVFHSRSKYVDLLRNFEEEIDNFYKGGIIIV